MKAKKPEVLAWEQDCHLFLSCVVDSLSGEDILIAQNDGRISISEPPMALGPREFLLLPLLVISWPHQDLMA